MSTELLWSKWGAIGQCETLNTKPLICMVYFLNVTEYFTTLTGKDDSRKEKIAWFADSASESEDVPTLDHLLTGRSISAISACQMKEMATIDQPGGSERPASKWLEALSEPSSRESCHYYSRSYC